VLARLANAFAVAYEKQFKEKAPADPDGLERQCAELRELQLPAALRPRLVLILGAVQGEFLRNNHGGVWQIADGPLVSVLAPNDDFESPFARTVNPVFLAARMAGVTDEPAGSPAGLVELLSQAQGRTLVLTNNPSAVQARLADFTDPALERGMDLLQAGKTAEAVKVFDGMLRREAHRRNVNLALRVGQVLYEHKQLAAVEAIMDRVADQPTADARAFNLLGLALLDRDPRAAANAFKKALRCDLHFGPAYLNLAQAYQRAGDPPSAVACLKRYLELLPSGPLAADATRRLGELEDGR
jgi:tetratricopeptide (TPR) repeat protein